MLDTLLRILVTKRTTLFVFAYLFLIATAEQINSFLSSLFGTLYPTPYDTSVTMTIQSDTSYLVYTGLFSTLFFYGAALLVKPKEKEGDTDETRLLVENIIKKIALYTYVTSFFFGFSQILAIFAADGCSVKAVATFIAFILLYVSFALPFFCVQSFAGKKIPQLLLAILPFVLLLSLFGVSFKAYGTPYTRRLAEQDYTTLTRINLLNNVISTRYYDLKIPSKTFPSSLKDLLSRAGDETSSYPLSATDIIDPNTGNPFIIHNFGTSTKEALAYLDASFYKGRTGTGVYEICTTLNLDAVTIEQTLKRTLSINPTGYTTTSKSGPFCSKNIYTIQEDQTTIQEEQTMAP